jgi:hypothetical protein
VAGRARTGASGDHNPGCFRLHHGHHESGDDRTRTGGLSPDKRVLCTSELRPRTARRRASSRERGWDSNPRSRAHEAREDSLSSTAQVWPAGVEPAISGARSRWGGRLPYSQAKVRAVPPAGLEPAASGLRARRHRRFDHGGTRAPAAGLEPAPSRLTVARLADSTTPERTAEGEGLEPPRPASPPVFETGYRAGGSPSEVAPAGVEPATLRLRGGSSAC